MEQFVAVPDIMKVLEVGKQTQRKVLPFESVSGIIEERYSAAGGNVLTSISEPEKTYS